ncbi:hypothetical protein QJQ45_015301 [Haematococcus lacustris]|nr:hypothetical protein QJQ45_015301 [Haematococcus lacustris]
MFTISTRTRTAFLAEALRCLRDVLPWLVVLLALCVETFYAPESPALVALYLTAGISVTATLDIPQSATASSKAPCHQCTQPVATVDATCSTVTAPWTAEAKAKAVINISASATMNMDLNTSHHHSRSSILVIPSFNMFTISTRTRTAFLAEALRCLRDVLPWLVVLLALCVETFYAPESPALVALYLTAGISVTATLDIPQSATASSKAPCHQCTQPVATVDATCSTVTAPCRTAEAKAKAVINISASATMNMDLNTAHHHSRSSILVIRNTTCLPFGIAMLYSTCQASPSLCANRAPSVTQLNMCHSRPSFNMFTISTRTRTAFLAEALRCLRDVLPWLVVLLALCVETFYAPESPALVALYLTAGISVTATLDIPQSATASSKAPCHQCTQPVATVDATCSTVTAPWTAEAKAKAVINISASATMNMDLNTSHHHSRSSILVIRNTTCLPFGIAMLYSTCQASPSLCANRAPSVTQLNMCHSRPSFNMFTISTRTRTAFLAEALRCLRDVLPWLVVLLALCVETFYAPESPALVALYLTAGISVTATLDIPQSATASSKAPCHQCTQPVATVDATCSTVTAPWTAEAKAKAVINISASATMNMDLNTSHHHSRSSILVIRNTTCLPFGIAMLYSTCQASPSLCANRAPSVTQLNMCHSRPSFNMFTISTRTRTAFLAEALRCLRDVLPWLVVLLALCVETFYAPESPALVALYLTAGISVTATLDIPQSATASSKAPCHQCTQPVATVDATCSTVTAPWTAEAKAKAVINISASATMNMDLNTSHHHSRSSILVIPSFNMFTISTRTRTAFLAEALRCLRDVLPWLVVLLALCVETFYAPESPALVALYLTAGISVTATLDIPQSATASSKAPCHQCTQPVATVDATCSTVTAPWTAEAKAKAVINISASATMNMDLNTSHHHSRSSILDVLPWLVVLLALCVETFYAPESPALVALYLTAGISVTATLDIPQSATASSKAPCHQCTQPVATVDATCSTVTAPWNTLHSSAGAGPSDAAPCPSPPAPQEPAALAPWMPVTSLLPPYTSTALQLSTPMPAASQQPAPLPALAAAPLRPQPHHLRASAAAALAARAAKRSLSSCGALAGTARTSRC